MKKSVSSESRINARLNDEYDQCARSQPTCMLALSRDAHALMMAADVIDSCAQPYTHVSVVGATVPAVPDLHSSSFAGELRLAKMTLRPPTPPAAVTITPGAPRRGTSFHGKHVAHEARPVGTLH